MAVAKRRRPGLVRGALERLRANGRSEDARGRLSHMLRRWERRRRHWQSRPYYPAILDLAGRTCLVVGAGNVGEGKIEGLLNAGAKVKVVSLTATERVRRWAGESRIELELRPYERSDLEGCFLVISATENEDTNTTVAGDAEARQMLCNVVDVTHLCNFILPSIVRRGDLAIAVSTGGASPAMARRIRLSLGECYGDEYGLAMLILGSLREELKARYPAPEDRKIVFERMVYSNFMDLVRAGDVDAIEDWVERCIAEGPSYASSDEHHAMLQAARPECKLRFAPLQIEEVGTVVTGGPTGTAT